MITSEQILNLTSRQAVQSFIEQHYQNDSDAFVDEINKSFNQLLHGNLVEAESFLAPAVRCLSLLTGDYKGAILRLQARYAHWTGNHKKAEGKYKQAIDAFRKKRNQDEVAATRLGLLDVYMYRGNYPDALATGRAALKFFEKSGKKAAAARVMTNIGNVYHRMDKNKLALRYYDSAREYFLSGGGVPLAIVDYNRANVFANLNILDEAETLYASAAKIYRDNGLELIACKSEYSLAYLYFLAGKFSESLDIFDKVFDAFHELGDEKAAATTHLDLSEINIELNQFGTAIMQGQQASEVFKKLGYTYEEAKAEFFAAGASRRLGDLEQSELHLKRSERLFKREKNQFWQGMVGLEKTRLYTETGSISRADKESRLARKLFVANKDRRRRIDADIARMGVLMRSGKVAAATKLGEQLLDDSCTLNQRHEINHLLGESYFVRKEFAHALEHYKKAITSIETMLDGLMQDEVRFFFALDKYDTYVKSVACLLEMDKTDSAFLQHSQALAVLNQRIVPDALLKKEIPAHLLNTRNELRASLRKLQKTPASGERRHVTVEEELRKIEYNLWSNERKIRAAYQRQQSREATGAITADVRKYLKPGEQLINFIQMDNRIGAFVATEHSMRFVPCPLSEEDFRQSLHRLHYVLERDVYGGGRAPKSKDIVMYYLSELYESLIRPLGLDSEKKNLIFLVDGQFAQIPFNALIDDQGEYLKNRHLIRVIVNPQDLKDRGENIRIEAKANAIFAVTDVGLPMIDKERDILVGLFPKADVFTGESAASLALKDSLGTVDGFIHIASHASRASENPLFSRILMHDGPFYPFDLFDSGIKAELVSLSGCQTAAPGIYYGNAFSLAKAFYQAGARYVLASLWSVSDKISMAFMAEFYRHLKSADDIPEAFNRALGKTEGINENPALWSPFILIGI
ncbi:MAG: CHAT domain-containing tetratricopeptide repeat protein [Candidatus Zixiibacteriota bacterium]